MTSPATHAEEMDRIYGLQRHIYDLTRKYYLFGRDRLIASLAVPDGGSVLEIGCGTGRNLIATARRYPKAAIYGIDISTKMLETARHSVERAGLAARIHLAEGDAGRFDPSQLFGLPRFDRVFFSYSLSMIPDWREALRHATGLLGEGGELHVVDFGQMDGLPRWFRTAMFAWLARFQVSPRAELLRFLQVLPTDDTTRTQGCSLFADYARSALLKR